MPNGRAVNPRLNHEQPTDPVTGLGRRKIPASTQRPTRGTNVPVVYPRLMHKEVVDKTPFNLHVGDVLFVAKTHTCFGTGTARLSRVASWREVNAELARPENRLPRIDPANPNPIAVDRMVDSRYKVTLAKYEVLEQNINDFRSFLNSKNRQTMTEEFRRFVRASRVAFETSKTLYEEALGVYNGNGLPLNVFPDEDLFAVPVLSKWTVDGVLHSHELARSVIDEVYPSSSDSEVLYNVAVQGPCVLRNERHQKSHQFVDDAVDTGDTVFLLLIANPDADGNFVFEFKPATSRQINDLVSKTRFGLASPEVPYNLPGGQATNLNVYDLMSTAAAYKIGRVIDNRAVVGSSKKMLVNVCIEFMLADSLWKEVGHVYADNVRNERRNEMNLRGVTRQLLAAGMEERLAARELERNRRVQEQAERQQQIDRLEQAAQRIINRGRARLARREAMRLRHERDQQALVDAAGAVQAAIEQQAQADLAAVGADAAMVADAVADVEQLDLLEQIEAAAEADGAWVEAVEALGDDDFEEPLEAEDELMEQGEGEDNFLDVENEAVVDDVDVDAYLDALENMDRLEVEDVFMDAVDLNDAAQLVRQVFRIRLQARRLAAEEEAERLLEQARLERAAEEANMREQEQAQLDAMDAAADADALVEERRRVEDARIERERIELDLQQQQADAMQQDIDDQQHRLFARIVSANAARRLQRLIRRRDLERRAARIVKDNAARLLVAALRRRAEQRQALEQADREEAERQELLRKEAVVRRAVRLRLRQRLLQMAEDREREDERIDKAARLIERAFKLRQNRIQEAQQALEKEEVEAAIDAIAKATAEALIDVALENAKQEVQAQLDEQQQKLEEQIEQLQLQQQTEIEQVNQEELQIQLADQAQQAELQAKLQWAAIVASVASLVGVSYSLPYLSRSLSPFASPNSVRGMFTVRRTWLRQSTMPLLPRPVDSRLACVRRPYAPNERGLYNLGKRLTEGSFSRIKARDISFASLRSNMLLTDSAGLPVDFKQSYATGLLGLCTYNYRNLLSQKQSEQVQFRINAAFMDEMDFFGAADRAVRIDGLDVKKPTDMCAGYRHLDDNGLAFELCKYFNEVGQIQKYEEDGVLVNFSLEDMQTVDLLRLPEGHDLSRFYELAKGITEQEKTVNLSSALNLLFDIPFTMPWTGSANKATWTRSVDDRATWAESSQTRMQYMNNCATMNERTGYDFQFCSLITRLVSLGKHATVMLLLTKMNYSPTMLNEIQAAFGIANAAAGSGPLALPSVVAEPGPSTMVVPSVSPKAIGMQADTIVTNAFMQLMTGEGSQSFYEVQITVPPLEEHVDIPASSPMSDEYLTTTSAPPAKGSKSPFLPPANVSKLTADEVVYKNTTTINGESVSFEYFSLPPKPSPPPPKLPPKAPPSAAPLEASPAPQQPTSEDLKASLSLVDLDAKLAMNPDSVEAIERINEIVDRFNIENTKGFLQLAEDFTEQTVNILETKLAVLEEEEEPEKDSLDDYTVSGALKTGINVVGMAAVEGAKTALGLATVAMGALYAFDGALT